MSVYTPNHAATPGRRTLRLGNGERHPNARRDWTTFSAVVLLACALFACGGPPTPKPPLTQQRELGLLLEVAAYPNSDTTVVLLAMQQLMASRREWDGYAYFRRLAQAQPARRALFRSLEGVMQARVAGDVPLLRRVAWVEEAMGKLDQGATADPLLGRLARGLVFADLPPRFGKARQAVADLEAVLARRAELPLALDRGIYAALAQAHATLGEGERSRAMLQRAGLRALPGESGARVLGNLSVSAADGFRFGERRFLDEGNGVFVAEGYDFANLAFIVRNGFVVAIDAGTTERTARAAVDALRTVTKTPVKYVVLTHGHWDHVGGIAAVREAGSVVVGRRELLPELQRSGGRLPPLPYFAGRDTKLPEVKLDRLIEGPETLRDGEVALELLPVSGGETSDALFVYDRESGILFVGDAFMPYLGSPFAAEGSAEGYLQALETALALRPRKLVHGHPPLTTFFTLEALPGLHLALQELYARALAAARAARPLAEFQSEKFTPAALRNAPKAVLPYLIVRDTFVQRVYANHAGYWRADGEGMDHFTRAEWGAALDLLGGHEPAAFVRAANELNERGDAAMALRIAELGLTRHPSSTELRSARARALVQLRERYSQLNPFRFIVHSQQQAEELSPVQLGNPR